MTPVLLVSYSIIYVFKHVKTQLFVHDNYQLMRFAIGCQTKHYNI